MLFLSASSGTVKSFDPEGKSGTAWGMQARFGATRVEVETLQDVEREMLRFGRRTHVLTLSEPVHVRSRMLYRNEQCLRTPATTRLLWLDMDEGVPDGVDEEGWAREITKDWGSCDLLLLHSQSSMVKKEGVERPRRFHIVAMVAEPIPWDQAKAIAVAAGGDPAIYHPRQIVFFAPPRAPRHLFQDPDLMLDLGHRLTIWEGDTRFAEPTVPRITESTGRGRVKAPRAVLKALRASSEMEDEGSIPKLDSSVLRLFSTESTPEKVVVQGPWRHGDIIHTRYASTLFPSPSSMSSGAFDDLMVLVADKDIAAAMALPSLGPGRGRNSYIMSCAAKSIINPGEWEGKRWATVRELAYKEGRRSFQRGSPGRSRGALGTMCRAFTLQPHARRGFLQLAKSRGYEPALVAFTPAGEPLYDEPELQKYLDTLRAAFVAGVWVEMLRWWGRNRVDDDGPRPKRAKARHGAARAAVEAKAEKVIAQVQDAPDGERQSMAFRAMCWMKRWVQRAVLPPLIYKAVASAFAVALQRDGTGRQEATDLLARFEASGGGGGSLPPPLARLCVG